ncbi:long-chain-fatty-acid--CoA ligase [Ornithinimicrobium tianjinense]|uniref:Long-chain-fatty-acid--CoA ligase n=1 Tax=Ornithinimicrobium tianjinense TaxID=1195761 RepID=A0A917BQN9_9MICO|nr:long-chain fatty acid--CoA ligase [Ornithinimicrobium tianjinense]GGF53558.1 long-chain-fatty-acid--CoA ligase [Ornithinimicrobium tianjinense]
MNANLAVNVDATATTHPDRPAIILDDLVVTYGDLVASVRQLAGWLRDQGVGPGDRVAIMLPNLPAFPVLYFAALRLGAVVVPMNPLFRRREISYYLQDSGAKVLAAMPGEEAEAAAESTGTQLMTVGPEGLVAYLQGSEPVEEIAQRAGDDTAVILYTSGTTGQPKGAELSHDNLRSNLVTTTETLLHLDETDVVMGCLPLFHVFGMTCGMNTAFTTGAALTLIPRFDPAKALEVIQRDQVTVFEGVPTMYNALLAAAAQAEQTPDLSSLRLAVSGGASLPLEVMRRFEETFGATILEGYGLSETSPVASFNHPDRERKAGSIGIPVRGVEMKLTAPDGSDVDPADGETVGEICIRGENIMKGYWNKPEATAEVIDGDGWFHSGDLARRDADGFYFIVDRTKDMIIRGGLNIYPREIEEVLYEHPAVAEAAVIGVPHPELGEEVAAYVVRRPGTAVTEADLVEHVRGLVAPYKYPRTVTFIDELPKGATGKILKRELRGS